MQGRCRADAQIVRVAIRSCQESSDEIDVVNVVCLCVQPIVPRVSLARTTTSLGCIERQSSLLPSGSNRSLLLRRVAGYLPIQCSTSCGSGPQKSHAGSKVGSIVLRNALRPMHLLARSCARKAWSLLELMVVASLARFRALWASVVLRGFIGGSPTWRGF